VKTYDKLLKNLGMQNDELSAFTFKVNHN